jgi:hypothetical protein
VLRRGLPKAISYCPSSVTAYKETYTKLTLFCWIALSCSISSKLFTLEIQLYVGVIPCIGPVLLQNKTGVLREYMWFWQMPTGSTFLTNQRKTNQKTAHCRILEPLPQRWKPYVITTEPPLLLKLPVCIFSE